MIALISIVGQTGGVGPGGDTRRGIRVMEGSSAPIPTSYPFIYFFLTEKVPSSYTFFWQMMAGPLPQTWFITLHQKTHTNTHTHTHTHTYSPLATCEVCVSIHLF